ncbi:ester cyclase [Salinigranum rubrum]|uniref:Ester cyclase n=1 Tax=Salinigranum rubrum TaxID=755307 RepID=A0A2I8VP24_9EURY|nr:ester cyclase [Salinigranum rubrum]AUV83672.1 ester cyclase [Salinigranum rubrum]
MSTERTHDLDANKAVVRRFVETVWQRGDVSAMDELFTPDSVLHDPSDDVRGPEAFRTYNQRYLDAFPDLEYTIEDVLAEGDRVAFRARMRGTHRGPFMGIEPTGETFEGEGIIIARIEDGKIAERWASFDALGMLRQLGLVSDPADADV